MHEKLWVGHGVALVVVALLGGCGGKIEDAGPSVARTYGALDVANGTCAPVVGKTFTCGSNASLDGICAPGTKPVAHVLQADLSGGVTGAGYECLDAKGAVMTNEAFTGSACTSVGETYATAYQDCARNGFALGAFKTTGACALQDSNCSIVVTCCPA